MERRQAGGCTTTALSDILLVLSSFWDMVAAQVLTTINPIYLASYDMTIYVCSYGAITNSI